jgi:predicted membrane protein (TIGR00267 family)
MRRFFSEFRDYNRIAKIDKIVRRYFLMNTFDGLMIILGLMLGSMISGLSEPELVIKVSIAAAIAMAVSGIWGAYMAEHAERARELKKLERVTMHKLRNTKIERAFYAASIIVALVDGISPVLATMTVLIPFFIPGISIMAMYMASIAIAFSILALLGLFTAIVAKERIVPSIIRMLLAGVLSAVLGKVILGIF